MKAPYQEFYKENFKQIKVEGNGSIIFECFPGTKATTIFEDLESLGISYIFVNPSLTSNNSTLTLNRSFGSGYIGSYYIPQNNNFGIHFKTKDHKLEFKDYFGLKDNRIVPSKLSQECNLYFTRESLNTTTPIISTSYTYYLSQKCKELVYDTTYSLASEPIELYSYFVEYPVHYVNKMIEIKDKQEEYRDLFKEPYGIAFVTEAIRNMLKEYKENMQQVQVVPLNYEFEIKNGTIDKCSLSLTGDDVVDIDVGI